MNYLENYLELAVGVAIILMAVCLRYVRGLQTGWEIVMFWVYWIVGLFLIRHARKRKRNNSN
jgi:multisubunit Na+/H+ antiporter MnhB subunit